MYHYIVFHYIGIVPVTVLVLVGGCVVVVNTGIIKVVVGLVLSRTPSIVVVVGGAVVVVVGGVT